VIIRETSYDSSISTMWTLDIETAKALVKSLKTTSKGSWEYSNIIYPIESAIKAEQLQVNIYTEGNGTGQFATMLANTVGYIY
jgi:hypothetical protein